VLLQYRPPLLRWRHSGTS